MKSKRQLIALCGPTASGKTLLSYELASRLSCSLISFDSMQVYKGIAVLTQAPAQPPLAPQKTHLCEYVPLESEYSVGRFVQDATVLINEAWDHRKIPVLVGGTGLYLKALRDGIFDLPSDIDATQKKIVREDISRRKAAGENIYQKLQKIDPDYAAKIHANDTRRIVRALEVYELTKKTFTYWHGKTQGLGADWDFYTICLSWPRQKLYDRIDQRTRQMFDAGVADEVSAAAKSHVSKTASSAIGFREILAWKKGEMSKQDALASVQQSTRNYAKRQMSWFRNMQGVALVDVQEDSDFVGLAQQIAQGLSYCNE